MRAVQLLLGHTKTDSTVRYLGDDLDDALSLSEGIDLYQHYRPVVPCAVRPISTGRDYRDAAVQLPRTGHCGLPQRLLQANVADADHSDVRCGCAILLRRMQIPKNGLRDHEH